MYTLQVSKCSQVILTKHHRLSLVSHVRFSIAQYCNNYQLLFLASFGEEPEYEARYDSLATFQGFLSLAVSTESWARPGNEANDSHLTCVLSPSPLTCVYASIMYVITETCRVVSIVCCTVVSQ